MAPKGGRRLRAGRSSRQIGAEESEGRVGLFKSVKDLGNNLEQRVASVAMDFRDTEPHLSETDAPAPLALHGGATEYSPVQSGD